MKMLTAAIAYLSTCICLTSPVRGQPAAKPALTPPAAMPPRPAPSAPSGLSITIAAGPAWPRRDLALYANRSIAWSASARWRTAQSPFGISLTAGQSVLTHSSLVAEQLDLQLRTVLGTLMLPAKLAPGIELQARVSLGAASLRASAPRAHRRLSGVAYGLGAALSVSLTPSVRAELAIEQVSTLARLPKHRYLDIGLTHLTAGVVFQL